MSEARTAILYAIRKARKAGAAEPDQIAREAAELIADPARTQPKFEDQSSRARFIERATSERLTATVKQVPGIGHAPAAVSDYLTQVSLPHRIACPPMDRLTALDWGKIEIHAELAPNEPAVVNLADHAIAETGTLVFASRPESPTLFSFLPLHHIVLLDASTILRHQEDYWARVRATGNIHPRSINFVTGTSGTADIEAKNIRGAHGPRFMHIVIFG